MNYILDHLSVMTRQKGPKDVMIRNVNTVESQLPSLTDQKQYWDQRWTATSLPNEWQLRRGETLRRMLLNLPLAQPTILDFGCGTGWFAHQLSHIAEVTAIDLSEAAIEIAKSLYPNVNFIAHDLFQMSLPTEYYDVVVSQEVIAHVENQKEYLERCASVLKPRGYLLITTANKFVMDRLGWPESHGHIHQYLNMRRFKHILHDRFSVLHSTSIIPIGNRSILRLVNSYNLNAVARRFLSPDIIQRLKERAGLGYSLVALGQKKS